MSDPDLQALRDELSALRRKVNEIEECAQQALSVGSAANLRLTELREAVEHIANRIDNLRAEAKVIVDIQG